MTERMENALRHIKTSVDVDPWAVEVVEKVFRGVDDAIAEINNLVGDNFPNSYYVKIIKKHTKVGDTECSH